MREMGETGKPLERRKSKIYIVDKLKPVFSGRALTRCAWGGRGSGKTRSFATMAVLRGYEFGMRGEVGTILCARQFQNSLADSSLVELKWCINEVDIFREYYDVGEKYIKSKDGRINFQFIGLERNVDSVKSMGQILVCWVDEAHAVTNEAWMKLIPTLRPEGEGWNSELWVTWNPLYETCPVEQRFRYSTSKNIKKAEVHWMDNALFPKNLNERRLEDLEERPETYGHIWDGEYLEYLEGAYYTKQLLDLKRSKDTEKPRLLRLHIDPNMDILAFWDLGGTGLRSDATAIWIAQFIGESIYVLDYYEAQGQALDAHIAWLRKRGYAHGLMVLPHDGGTYDRVFSVSFESSLLKAGFRVQVVPNQGPGAVTNRINAVRRLFPRIHFDEDTTDLGLKALGAYHEKRIECNGHVRGGGAEHDWSSHAADAFGMMCVVYEQLREGGKGSITDAYVKRRKRRISGWLGI